MSQPSRVGRGQRDRNGDRVHRDRRDPRNGKSDSSSRSSHPPYYHNSTPPQTYSHEVPRVEHKDKSKWSNICSQRGIMMLCAVLTNILVLICVAASQAVMSGMSSMGGLAGGSFSINSAYSPFEGTELQQVRDLDMQYSQLRAPGIYGGVAFSLTNAAISLLFVVSGTKPLHRTSMKLLVAQFFFQLIGAVAYVVAVGLYLHFVIQVNATDVCKKRERLYARQGYTWMNCDVQGADAAVALFSLITVILYAVGCFFCAKAIQFLKRYHQDRRTSRPHTLSSDNYPEAVHSGNTAV
ncbi:MARVEL domain-containing protein 3 [Lepisosteus oculatus]|uniref:MARVEL domain-containing protein 3 n=1 Tax=Lepisosteus oculatus TaxID=7918 RepID=UPI003720BDE7